MAPRQWELLDLETPQAADGNMLVRLERVAICGTDKPSYVGLSASYPLEPGSTGHEGLGIVESCPSGKYKEGERVLLWAFDRGLFQEYVLAQDFLFDALWKRATEVNLTVQGDRTRLAYRSLVRE